MGDGQFIASGAADTVKVHRTQTGRCEHEGIVTDSREVFNVSFSSDGCKLLVRYRPVRIVGATSCQLKLFNTLNFTCEQVWTYDDLRYATLSPDGCQIVALAEDSTLIAFHNTSPVEAPQWIHSSDGVFYKFAQFSPDGRKILVSSVGEGAKIFNANSGDLEWLQECVGLSAAVFL